MCRAPALAVWGRGLGLAHQRAVAWPCLLGLPSHQTPSQWRWVRHRHAPACRAGWHVPTCRSRWAAQACHRALVRWWPHPHPYPRLPTWQQASYCSHTWRHTGQHRGWRTSSPRRHSGTQRWRTAAAAVPAAAPAAPPARGCTLCPPRQRWAPPALPRPCHVAQETRQAAAPSPTYPTRAAAAWMPRWRRREQEVPQLVPRQPGRRRRWRRVLHEQQPRQATGNGTLLALPLPLPHCVGTPHPRQQTQAVHWGGSPGGQPPALPRVQAAVPRHHRQQQPRGVQVQAAPHDPVPPPRRQAAAARRRWRRAAGCLAAPHGCHHLPRHAHSQVTGWHAPWRPPQVPRRWKPCLRWSRSRSSLPCCAVFKLPPHGLLPIPTLPCVPSSSACLLPSSPPLPPPILQL